MANCSPHDESRTLTDDNRLSSGESLSEANNTLLDREL